jgi:hypothetical protein
VVAAATEGYSGSDLMELASQVRHSLSDMLRAWLNDIYMLEACGALGCLRPGVGADVPDRLGVMCDPKDGLCGG